MLRKEKSKNTWILPALIVFIMIFSAFGYFINDNKGSAFDYNGYKFSQSNNGWLVKVGDKSFYSYYHPLDLEYINSTNISVKGDVYLIFDPEMPGLEYVDMMRLDLADLFSDKNVYGGVSKPSNLTLPFITCGSVNGTVIELSTGNESIISGSNDCYVIEAPSAMDLVRVNERFKFTYLGIMNASN